MALMKKYPNLIPVLALLSLFATFALAEVVREIYKTSRGDILAVGADADTTHSAFGTADSLNWITPMDARKTLGNKNIVLYAQNTKPNATMKVSIGLYHEYPAGTYKLFTISDEKTITFSADFVNGSGVYIPEDVYSWDTYGLPIYDVRITTKVDSGAVTLRPLPYGGNTPD